MNRSAFVLSLLLCTFASVSTFAQGCSSCAAGSCDCAGAGAPYGGLGYDGAIGADNFAPAVTNLYSGNGVGADFAEAIDSGAPISGGGGVAPANSFAGLGAGVGASSSSANVPDMIGDFFGSGYTFAAFGPVGTQMTVPAAGGDRRLKWSDNNSPFPRNRFFFNYHQFQDAVVDAAGESLSVDRYTFGVEKTLFGGLASVEFRAPFASTVSSEQANFGGGQATEFGNVSLATKILLAQSEGFAVATGLGIVFPTGNDAVVLDDSQDLTEIIFGNDAYHLQPFIGAYVAPNECWFFQFFSQLDFDLNGNLVTVPVESPTLSLRTTGADATATLQDQTLAAFDFSFGRWFWFDSPFVRRIAPMMELHYTTTLEDRDQPDFFPLAIDPFDAENRRDSLNLTYGLYWEVNPLTAVKIAGVTPLRTKAGDKQFDQEFGLQVVRRY